jgi:hypothetical protein
MSSSRTDPAAIVGVWELVSWRLIGGDGAMTEPLGPSPRGHLVYTAGGDMSVVISAAGRRPLADDPAARSVADRAAAFDGVHAYAGRWRVDGDEIIHVVGPATLPNYEGTEQRRRLVLNGDLMTLATPAGRAAHIAPGSGVSGQLVWRRRAPER